MADIFFKSAEHQQRWLSAMQHIGKVYGGRLDSEYGATLYILTADLDTWEQAQAYVDRDGIAFESLLREGEFSGGYSVLITLAGNLFNDRTTCSPVDLMRLDDDNFQVALTALQVRRRALPVEDFKAEQWNTPKERELYPDPATGLWRVAAEQPSIANIATSDGDKDIDAWLAQQPETEPALAVAQQQAMRDIPYVEVGEARPFQYHYRSGRLYVEVDVKHHDPDQGAAIVLYRVWRLPDGHLAAFKVDIRESE